MPADYRYCRPLLIVPLVSLIACTSDVRAPVSSPADRGSKPARTVVTGVQDGVHVVRKGDTLYSIAWRYGLDFKNIAAWNGISPPYVIYPEQKLKLTPPAVESRRQPTADPAPEQRRQGTARVESRVTAPASVPQAGSAGEPRWQWPTSGNLVEINLPTSTRGLNITGAVGQPVRAAAAGEVVYSGSGLLGYGKLIIIKHNETYLSAYAHNDTILIKEGMKVTPGQNIATMGIGNNGKPLLHFEIRKDGKPVDPIKYLPDRKS